MAQTLNDLKDALVALDTKIDEDLAQTAQLITAINALLAKLSAGADVTAEVAAVSSMITKITSDNAAVQKAIDDAAIVP